MTEAEKEAGPMTATYINPKLPSMIRNLYRADPREWSVRNVLNLAADLVQELVDLRAEPKIRAALEAALSAERNE